MLGRAVDPDAVTRIGVQTAEIRDLYDADLALIRPDQIVAWRGNRVPDDPGALLAQLGGAAKT